MSRLKMMSSGTSTPESVITRLKRSTETIKVESQTGMAEITETTNVVNITATETHVVGIATVMTEVTEATEMTGTVETMTDANSVTLIKEEAKDTEGSLRPSHITTTIIKVEAMMTAGTTTEVKEATLAIGHR